MNESPNSTPAATIDPLIADLDVLQLQALRTRIDERIKELRETGQAELLANFENACARLGISVREMCALTGRRKPRRGRPRLARTED